jgi:hypothetical protein
MRHLAVGSVRRGHPAEHDTRGCGKQPRHLHHFFLPFCRHSSRQPRIPADPPPAEIL